MAHNRVAAFVALSLFAGAVALSALKVATAFPRGLLVLACVLAAVNAGWYGLVRRGVARAVGVGVAAGLTAAALWLLVAHDPLVSALIVALLWLAFGAARVAFRLRVELPAAPPPGRGVLFYNPRSGGGKAVRLRLSEEARARGIEPVELGPGSDLETLVRAAVAAGADGLAMAGGDGSQAIVASVAAEHGLPYACIPAGTRNHFALDLGVARDDVVGALDAFVDGGERVVDLADVNGRVFVNNVSLGLYAQAVQRPGYREAKLRTLLETMPDTLGSAADPELDLQWTGPSGREHMRGVAILVSNNRYRLGRAVGSGTRPRIDDALLGVTVVGAPGPRRRLWREWSTPSFEVRSEWPVPAGIDGEATQLDPPLRFRIHPGTLRVRIAHHHLGASPSALQPDGIWEGILALAWIAAGRDPRPLPAPRAATPLRLTAPEHADGPAQAPDQADEHRADR
jgi:diacylglycerol kinase family enzyme